MTVSLAIRSAYFERLNGNVEVDSRIVPVMDSFAPDEAIPPFIVLGTQTAVEQSSKTCRGYTVTITVDIVTRFLDPDGRYQSELIAGQVEDLISPDRWTDIQVQGYEIGDTTKEMDTDITSRAGNHYIYRKLLTYRHEI